jgi:nitrogen fixation protein NifU and related proteins
MGDMRELYQEVILDHSRKPRNCTALEEPDRQADGFNPLCGDRVTVYIRLDGDRIEELSFQGAGCAISTASASLMTEFLRGRTVAEAASLFDRFHELVTGDPTGPDAEAPELGKLNVFAGVREYPSRVKCATLAWHTLHAALKDARTPVTTE